MVLHEPQLRPPGPVVEQQVDVEPHEDLVLEIRQDVLGQA
jgi:hypothetical protein